MLKNNIGVEVARGKFRDLLYKINPSFLEQWDEKGPIVLLDLKIDSNTNETIVHFVCKHLEIDLADYLLNYDNFLELINSDEKSIENSKNLKIFQFRQFIFSELYNGENPLYQCLQKLEINNINDKLISILKHFIHINVIENPNDYINQRTGHKTTFLHMLIEREQLELLNKFINMFRFCYDLFEPLDFFVKDYLNKTPIMAALETGNKNVIKLIYDNVKPKLNRQDMIRIKEYIDALNQSIRKGNKFLAAVLQNKLIITSKSNVKETVNCMKNQFTAEIDGRSFDFLWLDYLTLAKKFKIPLSQRDVEKLTRNVHKQILINRINKKMSENYTFVMLIINNFQEHFEQLNNFLKFLPYNFKIIFVSPKRTLDKFNFYIKQATIDYEPDLSSHPIREQDFSLESLLSFNVRTINEYKDEADYNQAKIVIKQTLKVNPSELDLKGKSCEFYEKLGDCYAYLVHNPLKSFEFYNKALDEYQQNNKLNVSYVKLFLKMCNFLMKVETDLSAKKYVFERLREICEGNGNNELIAKYYETKAKYFHIDRNYDKEIEFLKEALRIYENNPKITDECTQNKTMARIRNHIFVAYSNSDKDDEDDIGFEYLKKANEFFLKSSEDEIAMANYNFGLAYSEYEDKDEQNEAINSYLESIKYYKNFYKDEQNIDIANAFNNLGLVYEELEQYKEAYEYQMKALKLYQEIYKMDHEDIAMALNNLGTCYPNTQDKEKNYFYAKVHIRYVIEAHEMYKKFSKADTSLLYDVANTADNLGNMYLEANVNEHAIHYLKIALKIYDELKKYEDKREILLNLYQCDKQNQVYYQENIIKTSKQILGKEYDKIKNRFSQRFLKFRSEKNSLNEKMLDEIMIKLFFLPYEHKSKSDSTSTDEYSVQNLDDKTIDKIKNLDLTKPFYFPKKKIQHSQMSNEILIVAA